MFHEDQKDTRTTKYQRCHVYTGSPISVKGMTLREKHVRGFILLRIFFRRLHPVIRL